MFYTFLSFVHRPFSFLNSFTAAYQVRGQMLKGVKARRQDLARKGSTSNFDCCFSNLSRFKAAFSILYPSSSEHVSLPESTSPTFCFVFLLLLRTPEFFGAAELFSFWVGIYGVVPSSPILSTLPSSSTVAIGILYTFSPSRS